MRSPNPLLYTDSVTVYPRPLTHGTRGDGQFANGTGTVYANAIVTMRTDFSLGDDDHFGQPVNRANWDVKILSATDPAVTPDSLIVDQNGRQFLAMSKSTFRLTGDWIIHCKSND